MTDSELRRLRAKAYGPGGGITRLELERLRALEAQARPMTGTDAAPEPAGHAEAAPAEPRGAGRADEGASVRPDAVGRPSTSAEPAGGGEPSPDPDERTEAMPVGAPGDASLGPPLEESPAEHPRRRGRGIRGVAGRRGTFVAALAAVVAMLLGIGIGIGWAAWDGDAGPALTAAQQEWQDALDDEDFDAGSIRPVAADERAVVWTATRYGGDRTCVVIGDGARTAQDCRDTRTVRREGLSFSWAHHDAVATVQLVFDAAGGPAASLRWDDLVAYDDRFGSELERDIAEQLGGRGYSEGGLNVVGYHEGYPVWSALPRAEDPSGFCLVYYVPGEDAAASCSDLEAGITEPALIIPDPEAGTVAHMVLTVSEHAFPYLTITIRPLEVAQVDPDTGDELPGFDDTTGDPSP